MVARPCGCATAVPASTRRRATRCSRPSSPTKQDGRGLGLTLVREILARHGFEFGLDNAAEGGAEFWIRF
jgi:signal transduction histidine kinase